MHIQNNQMELYKAVHIILEQYGKGLIADKRFINFLTDYNAFDVRPAKRVMQVFLQMGYGEKVLEIDRTNPSDKQQRISNISYQLSQQNGFQKMYVDYVLDCICYGLGWEIPAFEEINECDAEEEESVDKYYVLVGDISFAMVNVAGGVFNIGATQEQMDYAAFDEKPSKQVTVSSFYLAETPVTQALWVAIMGDNPSHFKGDNLPVERVSWEECQEFIRLLNLKTGMKFRLPTEAEWEYAARGGQDSQSQKYAGANDNDKNDYMWFKENSFSQSHEVKSKLPNELGLYDMSGNISEWCSDWYFNSYANNNEQTDPKGPASGIAKVYRGGNWNDKAMNCRVSKRFYMSPMFRNKLVGLRLAATNIQ